MGKIRKIVLISLLVAIQIVLTGLIKIEIPIVKITFAFLPLALCSMIFGSLYGGMAAVISDLLCLFFFPNNFGFFPGFTLSAFLTGAVYGIVLYNKPKTILRILISVSIVCLFINLVINTYWLQIMYNKAFIALIPTRILKNIIMIPIQTTIIKLTWQYAVVPMEHSLKF